MPLPAIPVVMTIGRAIIAGGARRAAKKYGDDVVKQVQKSKEFKELQAKTLESRKLSAKQNNKRFKSKENTVQDNPLLKKRTEEKVLDLNNSPVEEIPLRFDMNNGGLLTDDRNMYKDGGGPGIEALRKEAPEVVERMGYQEGGSMDDQMLMVMTPPMESEMESDDDMEDNYTRFIMEEALSEEEEDMLTSKLEQDEQLSMLFDKIIDVAQEFAGSGPVNGPGSGVSDSIPARLSDGEFVFTAKAVEEIGEDSLMSMMKEAEAAADERQGFAEGEMVEEKPQALLSQTGIIQEDETGKGITEDMRKEVTKNIYS
jgi:hypothetical protein